MLWLKRNWFKICIIIILLIIGYFISNYYIQVLPKQNEKKLVQQEIDALFNKNIDCQKYDAKIKNLEQGTFKMTLFSGVFYSPKINSCLYVGSDWDKEIKVRDAMTGQDIFTEELKDMKQRLVGEEIKFLVGEYSKK